MLDKVARCPHCGRDVMAVVIDYIEEEDVRQLEEYEDLGYDIIEVPCSETHLDYKRCSKCPPKRTTNNWEISLLNNAIERIRNDMKTFEFNGRDVKGHFRSIMIIKEFIQELE